MGNRRDTIKEVAMTRRELIDSISSVSKFRVSVRKLASMPLTQLKEFYSFIYFGPVDNGGAHEA